MSIIPKPDIRLPGRAAFVAAGLLFIAGSAAAQGQAASVVVELFTSQSCSSCPPAEAYLGELVKRPDLLALEWHVDYWNRLSYGSAGAWTDPFSSAEATSRQRAYDGVIQGQGVYTPQMVVDGAAELVGSDRGSAEAAIASAAAHAKPVSLALEPLSGGGGYALTVAGLPARPVTLLQVNYLPSAATKVLRGENNGRALANHNVVTTAHELAGWQEGKAIRIDPPAAGERCAVIAQEAPLGRVLGAATCPADAG